MMNTDMYNKKVMSLLKDNNICKNKQINKLRSHKLWNEKLHHNLQNIIKKQKQIVITN